MNNIAYLKVRLVGAVTKTGKSRTRTGKGCLQEQVSQITTSLYIGTESLTDINNYY